MFNNFPPLSLWQLGDVAMGKAPYFQFYPQDWLSDAKVTVMTLEERGAYHHLLCHMWVSGQDCSLPADDLYLMRLLSIRPAKWKKLKAVLLDGETPVFTVENGRLSNARLSEENQKMKIKSQKNSQNASVRWSDNEDKSLKEGDGDDANALQTQCLSDTDTDTDSNTPLNPPKGGGRKSRSKFPDCPHETLLELWRETNPDKPQPQIWDAVHQRNLAARWRHGFTTKSRKTCEPFYLDLDAALAWWRRLFEYCAKQRQLADNSWFTLHWLIGPKNFSKLIAGNYDNKRQTNGTSGPVKAGSAAGMPEHKLAKASQE